MKRLIYALFMGFYFSIAFFGLGPVFFADGGFQERMLTLAIVSVVGIVLSVLFIKWMRKNDMKSWLIYPPFIFIIFVFILFRGWEIF